MRSPARVLRVRESWLLLPGPAWTFCSLIPFIIHGVSGSLLLETYLCFQCQGLKEESEGFLWGQPPSAVSWKPQRKLRVPVQEGLGCRLVTETQLPMTPAQRVHCFVGPGLKDGLQRLWFGRFLSVSLTGSVIS